MNSSGGNRQHYNSVIHKQRRRNEVGPAVCPSVEDLNLVYQEPSDPQSPSHPRPAECGSRQAIQAGPDHSNRVVPPSRGFPSNMQQVAPASNRLVCHKVQQQAASICVASTGSPGLSSGWTSLPWEDLDAYAFPPTAILGKVVEKLQDIPCKKISGPTIRRKID